VIIWLNGPFGAGKTTTVRELLKTSPSLVELDTELLGYALRPALTSRHPVGDFQEWPAWRRLVVTALTELARADVGDVVVPQTVVVEEYWDEITGALVDHGIQVAAVTLHVDLADDAGRVPAARWRRERRRDYDSALPWLRAKTHVLDTTAISPEDVAEAVLAALPRASQHQPQV
jgi:hypothetical protein